MHSYHLQLTDGTERDVKADEARTHDGTLAFFNSAGELVVAYGADAWVLCEMERRDDKG